MKATKEGYEAKQPGKTVHRSFLYEKQMETTSDGCCAGAALDGLEEAD